MGIKSTILLVGALAFSAVAAPIPDDCPNAPEVEQPPTTTTGLTAEKLTLIAPETASCSGATFADECADAAKAVTALNKSFETYKITEPSEQAALVAYTLFESGNYKYSRNHYPGRPGQGTRMMAMPPFVSKYATAVAGADKVAEAEAAGGDAGLNAVLALVNSDDEKSFGSAAWFLSTQCTAEVRAGLAAGTVEGWHEFLTACVETTAAPERDTIWDATKLNW